MERTFPRHALAQVLAYDGDDCLVWPHCRTPKGYGRIRIDGPLYYVHRLVCEHYHGLPPSPKHQARHLCGRGHLGCVSPKHIVWATPEENQGDRVVHGTSTRGEQNVHHILTVDDVLAIRRLPEPVDTGALARRYGVGKYTIRAVRRRTAWKWLSDDPQPRLDR